MRIVDVVQSAMKNRIHVVRREIFVGAEIGDEEVSDDDIIAHIGSSEEAVDDMDSLMRGGLDDIDEPNEDDLSGRE